MNDDYEIGYGKPPKHTQFKPGESGNRKGRPPKEPVDLIDVFEDIFMTKEKININGEQQYRAGLELVLMKILEQALKSNKPSDRRLVLELLRMLKIHERFNDFDLDGFNLE